MKDDLARYIFYNGGSGKDTLQSSENHGEDVETINHLNNDFECFIV